MTGSGKTGLCISLLEEAAIDGIPALVIDPKGDLSTCCSPSRTLAAEDFRPGSTRRGAARRACAPWSVRGPQAEPGATDWRLGPGPERIERLREAADSPSTRRGAAPACRCPCCGRSMRRRRRSGPTSRRAARAGHHGRDSGLLALLGVDADPLQSREHILLSSILLDTAWRRGRDLDLAPADRRSPEPAVLTGRRLRPRDVLPGQGPVRAGDGSTTCSPRRASAWMEGEPLDLQNRLLLDPEGRPRIAILSIAHLGDAERMFFVTLLLNEVVAWMRGQSGTTSACARCSTWTRCSATFPPTANPPSKAPMLTLLKQARAFGVGVVLATQNPVDLDYKALSKRGTWFLGRLQTERDKARVLEGLEGASARRRRAFDRRRDGADARGSAKPGLPDEQRTRGPAGAVPDAVGPVVPARPAHPGADPAPGRGSPLRLGEGRRRRVADGDLPGATRARRRCRAVERSRAPGHHRYPGCAGGGGGVRGACRAGRRSQVLQDLGRRVQDVPLPGRQSDPSAVPGPEAHGTAGRDTAGVPDPRPRGGAGAARRRDREAPKAVRAQAQRPPGTHPQGRGTRREGTVGVRPAQNSRRPYRSARPCWVPCLAERP
jgi:hypothetical protein